MPRGRNTDTAQGVLFTQTSGAWAAGVKAALPADAGANRGVFGLSLAWVSCPSAGNCSAVGSYQDSSGNRQGVLLTQSAGAWATGLKAGLPAGAASDPFVRLVSVSCPSAGNCTAVGTYNAASITARNANGKSPAIKRRFTITHK